MVHSTPGDPRFAEVEENVTFQLRFPGGVLANCTSSYGAGLNRFRVFKPRGSFELEPALSYSGLKMRVLRGGAVEERSQPAEVITAARKAMYQVKKALFGENEAPQA